MPTIRWRVVWARCEVMLTFCPTRRLSSGRLAGSRLAEADDGDQAAAVRSQTSRHNRAARRPARRGLLGIAPARAFATGLAEPATRHSDHEAALGAR